MDVAFHLPMWAVWLFCIPLGAVCVAILVWFAWLGIKLSRNRSRA